MAIRDHYDPLERLQTLICSHIETLLRDEARHSTTFTEMHALSEQRLGQIKKMRDAYENIEVKYLSLALLGIMNRVMVWYRRGGPLPPHQIGRLFGALFLNGAAATIWL